MLNDNYIPFSIEELKENPLLQPYETPFGAIPFDRIKLHHFLPAIIEGVRLEAEQIDIISSNPQPPTFENTILAFEYTGEILTRSLNAFNTLLNVRSDDEIQRLAEEVFPLTTDHFNNISLNSKLFQRIKTIFENNNNSLNKEQQRLLENTYNEFIKAGANLNKKEKNSYRKLTLNLSKLELKFQENLLKETDSFTLHINDESQLQGLPDTVKDSAAIAAKEHNKKGWIFTLNKPSYIPFLTYSSNRDLRRELYMAYNTLGAKGDKYDNRTLVVQIVNNRLKLANLLGYSCYSDYVVSDRMAGNTDAVYSLLGKLCWAYLPQAVREIEELKALAKEVDGDKIDFMPWDFLYYSDKLKRKKYDINDEVLRPYFSIKQVLKGVERLSTRLFGITFRPNKNIPVYHPDVKVFEVYDYDGKFLSLLYCDFFPRKGKHSGAWMDSIKGQWKTADGVNHRPHITFTTNFTKPTEELPALLSFDEVNTLLHEFGHCLHGFFSDVTYESLCSPDVLWDFVELPSQIMENFVTEKDFVNSFAFHHKTGESIPEEILTNLRQARNFNVGYDCIRQVALGLIDQRWHGIEEPFEGDVIKFEQKAIEAIKLLPSITGSGITPQFSHIMTGGYSAGYYSYKWAEMLEADAFSVFKENGVFSTKVAQSFRDNILSRGNSEHPMVLYKRFRGKNPNINAMLTRDLITTPTQ